MIPYKTTIYSEREARELYEISRARPFTRPKNPHNSSLIRKISYGIWSPLPRQRGYDGEYLPIEELPEELKYYVDALSEFRGVEQNQVAILGYVNECDHIGYHQHAEDRENLDQSVTVISLGDVRTLSLRAMAYLGKDENGNDKYARDTHGEVEAFDTAHGSVYVLPSSYNVTHEHAILDDKRPRTLRISINCKHISPADIERGMKKLAGKGPKATVLPFVREPGPPRIYNIKSGQFPKDAVYVGRAYGIWPYTPFGNHKRHDLSTAEGQAAWSVEVTEKMKSPEFRAQLESLRGKDLLCWCSPKEEPHCHARTWLELANANVTPPT